MHSAAIHLELIYDGEIEEWERCSGLVLENLQCKYLVSFLLETFINLSI